MAAPQQNVLDLIKCFRRQWSLVCECERTTVCGADNMLLMLQLSVADFNKKNGNGYTAYLSDVLLTWKHLVKDKLELINNGSPVPKNYDSIRNMYDQLLKNSNSLDLIDLYAAFSKPDSSTAVNFSSDQLQNFLLGQQSESADPSPLPVSTPCKNNMDFVKMKEVVKRIFYSYLSLLVNSKNDIALAQVINCPERGLGREAFTDLKHASKNKQMALFLVATFIRAVELGGKGYAPSEADPLRKHIKGLSQFVHFIDRLEEILGETRSASNAGELILSAIKMQLIKGRGSGDSFSEAVVEVAQELDLRIKNTHNLSTENEGSTGISPARPKIRAINRGTALCGRETMKALLILLDEEAACPPSRNKADLLSADVDNAVFGAISLLTLFRSPEQNGSSPKALSHRVQKCVDIKNPKLKQNLIRSQFSCTYKDDSAIQIKPFAFPSMSQVPSCIHPAPKIVPVLCFDDDAAVLTGDVPKEKIALQINSGNGDFPVKVKATNNHIRKSTKRKQFDNAENQNILDDEPAQKKTAPPNKLKKASMAKNTSKSAAKKQITGQAKLTSFFRV